jgi:hypothetical protein
LFGSMTGLASIKPPGRSFEDWERFLREAIPIASMEREGIAAPLGRAFFRRKRWLENAREKGLTFQQADAAWNADYERERAAILESLKQTDAQRVSAMREREDPRGRRRSARPSAELFDRADEAPDWSDQMQTFATESGLP